MAKKIYCSCCGRQLVSYPTTPNEKHIVNKYNAVRLVGNQVACSKCAEDLDKNGMFPEEVAALLPEELDAFGY